MAARNRLITALGTVALALLLSLTGCEFEGVHLGETTESGSSDPDAIVESRIVGSVGDGPIIDARLRVFSNTGEELEKTWSDSTADYDLTIRTRGSNYPLTLIADQGTDIVTNAPPDFSLKTVVLQPGNNREVANLNPYSTLIVKAAQKAGGITEESIAAATEAVLERYGFGLDSDLVPDPLFSPMDDNNVHVIVKASETMGEMIRRTRDAMITIGSSVDGDAVMTALAADLTDGWIDGEGEQGHDPRIAAVANVASAPVMLEALANRLHVEGSDATGAMDAAIYHVRPSATGRSQDVVIQASAIAQTMRALQAAAQVTSDKRISEALALLAETEPGVTSIQSLPDGIDHLLNHDFLTRIAGSDERTLSAINAAARGEASPITDEPEQTRDDANTETDGDTEDTLTGDADSETESGNETSSTEDSTNDTNTTEETDTGTGSDTNTESSEDTSTDEQSPDQQVEDDSPAVLWSQDHWELFDGGDHFLETGFSLDRLSGTSFTAEAIIQYTGEADRTWSPIFGSGKETFRHDQILNIGKVDGNNDLRVNVAGLDAFSVSGTELFDGQERHVAVVVSPETIDVYVDQTRVATRDNETGTITTSSELLIGATGHADNERWFGWIGPARITGTALEPSQFLIADGSGDGESLEPKPNRAPTIAGTPETSLVVGNPWSFAPDAADPDGDTLVFSISGEPNWVQFDSTTGKAWGTPEAAGSFGPITITADDGTDTASLEPFTLEVVEPALGTALVSWTPPTEREDGTTLDDLAGYHVYWGKDPDDLRHTVPIKGEGQTSHLVENLEAGTWYFAVTAYCSNGLESAKSNVGSKTIE